MTALVLFSVVGISAVALTVSADKANVTITERSLYGDRSAAEGLTITSMSHFAHHLRWDTVYTIGKTPQTVYRFHASKTSEASIDFSYYISLHSAVSYGCDYSIPADEQYGIAKAYKELYDSTQPGGESKTTVNLKDFYDYYPVGMDISLPGVIWSGNDYEDLVEDHLGSEKYIRRVFSDFFRIPIIENDSYEIHVTKDATGRSVSMGMATADDSESYYFETNSAITEDCCFFTINNRTSTGNPIDTSLIPGGYGIYAFHYTESSNMYTTDSIPGVVGIDADSLAMVYKLENDVIVYNLFLSKDNTKLLLITLENEVFQFTVIDIPSMTQIQKFELEGFVSQSYTLHNHGDFIVLTSWDSLALVALESDGSYTFQFSSPTARKINAEYSYITATSAMQYNGEKLAIVNTIREDRYSSSELCSFYIAVYHHDGLLYYGEYDNSLSINPDTSDYNANCLPFGSHAYRIAWE